MKTYYLGPQKTYSELAAENVGGELIQRETLEDVAHSIQENDRGVFPIYNPECGVMEDHLALIARYGLKRVDRIMIPIRFYLGGYRNSNALYSHEKALALCSRYISQHGLKGTAVTSTARGIEIVQEQRSGMAIARKEAFLESNLDIIAEDIGNKTSDIPNFTEFWAVQKA